MVQHPDLLEPVYKKGGEPFVKAMLDAKKKKESGGH
jgi:hypothetical protein